MTIVTNLDDIRRLIAEQQPAFEVMREALEFGDAITDDALDALIETIAAPIIAAIDCKQCGNCCRSLDVCLIPSDIPRLATALLITPDQVMTRYADQDLGASQDEWAIIPQHPCPMLRGNLCSIYDDRPHACRLYPQFTPDFRYNLEDTIEGAATCPIIYNVLVTLAAQVEPLPTDITDFGDHSGIETE